MALVLAVETEWGGAKGRNGVWQLVLSRRENCGGM